MLNNGFERMDETARVSEGQGKRKTKGGQYCHELEAGKLLINVIRKHWN